MRFLALLTLLLPFSALAEDRGAQFQNLDKMIEELNLRAHFAPGRAPKKQLKVAILDNGFRYAAEEIGKSLPANTEIHPGSVPTQGEEDSHGFYMARILWSLISLGGKETRYAPAEFHLYNSYGYTNLKNAVEDVIARKIDIVLYAQTWEYGGNHDGRGFINALVNQATEAGVLWINNSGNFGAGTFNSAIENGRDDWLKLPDLNSSVAIRCEQNPTGKCPLRAVLSWNSFSDDVEIGTDKDLDFVLTDDTLNVIASSSLIQKANPPANQPGVSKYAREILSAELAPGAYFLRVKNRSKNFSALDRLRITTSGEFLTLPRADKQESLLAPADNARVISVGALDSDRTGISLRMRKPELWTNSLVSLSRENNYKGSSNSAAMVAAGAIVLLSQENLSRENFLSRTSQSIPTGEVGQGYSLEQLGFSPTGPGSCFQPVNVDATTPAYVQQLLQFQGVLVESSAGLKLMYPYDPIRLLPGIVRRRFDDMLVITPQGPGIFARTGLWNMPQGFYELVQTPWGQKICGTSANAPSFARAFRLPSR
jgi:hypothetical protein